MAFVDGTPSPELLDPSGEYASATAFVRQAFEEGVHVVRHDLPGGHGTVYALCGSAEPLPEYGAARGDAFLDTEFFMRGSGGPIYVLGSHVDARGCLNRPNDWGVLSENADPSQMRIGGRVAPEAMAEFRRRIEHAAYSVMYGQLANVEAFLSLEGNATAREGKSGQQKFLGSLRASRLFRWLTSGTDQ